MTSSKLRQKYLEFFKSKGHAILPSSSLVPENDPTVLFTTAGMHPLVPYLMGEKHPMGNRLVNSQKCIRTQDIEEVGDATHFTFFEMLGNWSLGDYFKKESLTWSLEFLTCQEWLGLEKEKLAVSVFKGDKDAPRDEEAAKIWQKLGISKKRIAYLPKSENWWGPAGQTGPCGPDSEIFYWTGDKKAPNKFDFKNEKWVEIWNNVFMQYNKKTDNTFELLKQKNVDTGFGLERVTAILNNKKSAYETDLFEPIINRIKKQELRIKNREIRIIADHVKASVFIIAEGIEPSNVQQGYVLRRLIRIAMRYCSNLVPLAQEVQKIYKDIYPEVNNPEILKIIKSEQDKFNKTLDHGMQKLNSLKRKNKKITGKQAFDMYQTYGLPLDIMKDEIQVNQKEFEKAMKAHQKMSRAGAEKKFKAGLADNSDQTIKLHTATHLLLAALREVLGNNVKQAGSNITPERLRFDFTYPEKLGETTLEKVQSIVNREIQAKLPVTCTETTLQKAEKQGALATFKGKYPDKVRVYTIGEKDSCEICAGPHVKNTSELGKFKIIKQESSSAGVRRIKAILE